MNKTTKFLRHRGFTLVEILLVIAIIGLLSSVVLASMNVVRGKARDAQRVVNLNQIANAIALYETDNGVPPGLEGVEYVNGNPEWIPGLVPKYIHAVPSDPVDNGEKKFHYVRQGTNYEVIAFMEQYGNQTACGDGGPSGCQYFEKATGEFLVVANPGASGWRFASSSEVVTLPPPEATTTPPTETTPPPTATTTPPTATTPPPTATTTAPCPSTATATSLATPCHFRLVGSPTTNTASFAWDDVSGENKYNFYRKLSTDSAWSSMYVWLMSNVTSYTETVLLPGTSYDFRVKACLTGNINCSEYAYLYGVVTPPSGASDTIAPSTPVNLIATPVSPTQVNLTWSASADNVGVAGYNVFRAPSISLIGVSASPQFTDGTVTGGTTYSYSVSAYDTAGNFSNRSTEVSVTTSNTNPPACGSTSSDPVTPTAVSGSVSSAPTVTTNAANCIDADSAKFNGGVVPYSTTATGYFRYSQVRPSTCVNTFGIRTPSSGGASIPSGTSATPYAFTVDTLLPQTTYYHCAIALNSSGTTYGTLATFTTTASTTATSGSHIALGAGTQPANGTALPGAYGVPFTTFTLSNNGDTASYTYAFSIRRTGTAPDAALKRVLIQTLTPTTQTVAGPYAATSPGDWAFGGRPSYVYTFRLTPGESKTFTIQGEIADNIGAYNGQTIGLELYQMNASLPVVGARPIVGATHTLVDPNAPADLSTLSISGRFINAFTGQPVANVIVRRFVSLQPIFLYADTSGVFSFSTTTTDVTTATSKGFIYTVSCYIQSQHDNLATIVRNTNNSLAINSNIFDPLNTASRNINPLTTNIVQLGDLPLWPAKNITINSDIPVKFTIAYPEEASSVGNTAFMTQHNLTNAVPLDYDTIVTLTDASGTSYVSPAHRYARDAGCTDSVLNFSGGQFTWQ